MVDFRRWITAFAVLTLFAALASAQGLGTTTPFSCATNISSTPQIRAEGFTEEVGDIVLTCTGGPVTALSPIPPQNTAPTNPIPSVNITVFLNTAVTSRLLSVSGGTASEALLLIDEPGNGQPSAAGAGFGPQAPQTVCPTPLTGCAEFVSSAGGVLVATNAPQGAAATTNGFNVFQGVVSGNSVTWFGVPVLPPGTTGITRIFRLTNIRANATVLGGGSAAGATPVIASIAVSIPSTLPITNATPTVGFVQSGLATSATGSTGLNQCATQTRSAVNTLTFTENFATAFKTRVAPGPGAFTGQGTAQTPLSTGGQTIPGFNYQASESNFIASVNGGIAGLADFGTRLKATFNNVPTGVRLFVSVNNVTNGALPLATTAVPPAGSIGANSFTSTFAQLVVGESVVDGTSSTGTFLPTVANSDNAPGSSGNVPVLEIPVTNGSAVAVWEILNSNPSGIDTAKFAVFTTFTSNVASNSPPAGTGTVTLSFAPSPPTAFTAAAGAAASSGLPIPRFSAGSSSANIFQINVCRTILLFPFVTNQAGFDTGLAIANTSTDPFGTGPQAGTCTLNWYSGGTAPAPTTTASVASGTVFTALASTTVSGFQGYMIAVCQFQYAHGFAFISDLGARNLAMGYLSLVIPDPTGAGTRQTSAPGCNSASNSSGGVPCNAGEEAAH